MCTAAAYRTRNFYFGRTLDNYFSYNEQVAIAPVNFNFRFMADKRNDKSYAIIGTAYVCDDYPLFYDGMNEKGLCMAGLNFVGNAVFSDEKENMDNIPVYQLIPWILTQCESVRDAEKLLGELNITAVPFNDALPVAELHWLIADKNESIAVECMKDGLHVYKNEADVLTNNPPFEYQMHNLNNYMHLTPYSPSDSFSDRIRLEHYSRGMGALGLPGDLSSQSRFVRAAFVMTNSVAADDEMSCVNQFFHILGSVAQQRGCCRVGDAYEITLYTSCMDAQRGIYYYTTYGNHQICAVDMHRADLCSDRLTCYELAKSENIQFHN